MIYRKEGKALESYIFVLYRGRASVGKFPAQILSLGNNGAQVVHFSDFLGPCAPSETCWLFMDMFTPEEVEFVLFLQCIYFVKHGKKRFVNCKIFM